jgi:hypothetical protein
MCFNSNILPFPEHLSLKYNNQYIPPEYANFVQIILIYLPSCTYGRLFKMRKDDVSRKQTAGKPQKENSRERVYQQLRRH